MQELDIFKNQLEGSLSPTFSQLEKLAIDPAMLASSQQWALSGGAALRELYLISSGRDCHGGSDYSYCVGGWRYRGRNWCHSFISILRCLPALSRLGLNGYAEHEMKAQGFTALEQLVRERPGLCVEEARHACFSDVAPSEDWMDQIWYQT